jgi:microcompartment protein CcmK/EutM
MDSVSAGSSARFTSQTNNTPLDAFIADGIDSLELGGEVSYRKE